MPKWCPDNSETLSGCFRNQCPDAAEICSQTAGISKNSYFYWQNKLRESAFTELAKIEDPEKIVPNGWVQIEPKQAQHVKEALNIEINSCHITVNADTDPELLKKVCRTLRSL